MVVRLFLNLLHPLSSILLFYQIYKLVIGFSSVLRFASNLLAVGQTVFTINKRLASLVVSRTENRTSPNIKVIKHQRLPHLNGQSVRYCPTQNFEPPSVIR